MTPSAAAIAMALLLKKSPPVSCARTQTAAAIRKARKANPKGARELYRGLRFATYAAMVDAFAKAEAARKQ